MLPTCVINPIMWPKIHFTWLDRVCLLKIDLIQISLMWLDMKKASGTSFFSQAFDRVRVNILPSCFSFLSSNENPSSVIFVKFSLIFSILVALFIGYSGSTQFGLAQITKMWLDLVGLINLDLAETHPLRLAKVHRDSTKSEKLNDYNEFTVTWLIGNY